MNIHKVISSNKVHQSPADIHVYHVHHGEKSSTYVCFSVNTHSYYIDKLIPINFKNYLYMLNSVTNYLKQIFCFDGTAAHCAQHSSAVPRRDPSKQKSVKHLDIYNCCD